MTFLSETSLFGSSMIPLVAREQIAHFPSGPVTAAAVKVVFTISGWAQVYSPAGEVILEAGTILTIPSGVECRGFPTGHARTVTLYIRLEYMADQVRWLSVSHPLVHHLHRVLDGDPEPHTLQLPSSAMHELTPALVGLTQSMLNPCGDFAILSNAAEVFDAVGRLSGVSSGSLVPVRTLPRWELATAMALLRADLHRPWKIEKLAREVAVSPSQLARLFRAQVGISPAAFLRQLRADRMAELLATTSLNIGEIGAAVGWRDAAVASRLFKQRYGVTPRTYASSYRRGANEPPALP